MSTIQKRAVLLLLALFFAAVCAAAAEIIARRICLDEYGFTNEIFTDGSEAFALNDCELSDGVMTVTGSDPHFTVSSFGQTFSRIRMAFRESPVQDIDLKIYYVPSGGSISENNTTEKKIEAGKKQGYVYLPRSTYDYLRFDIEQNVTLDGIYVGDREWSVLPYRHRWIRMGVIFCTVFIPLSVLILSKTKRRSEETGGGKRRFSCSVLLCNLFLSLTVFFFQPLEHILVNQRFLQIQYVSIWWIQLLLAVFIALALSVLMYIIPRKASGIAAAGALGLGLAFLIQSLVLNADRIIPMDISWPIRVLNIFIWFGIAAAILSASIHFSGEYEKTVNTVKCTIAWVLIVFQVMNFVVLATTVDLSQSPATEEASTVTQQTGTFADREKEILSISMERGLPYLIKDWFMSRSPDGKTDFNGFPDRR